MSVDCQPRLWAVSLLLRNWRWRPRCLLFVDFSVKERLLAVYVKRAMIGRQTVVRDVGTNWFSLIPLHASESHDVKKVEREGKLNRKKILGVVVLWEEQYFFYTGYFWFLFIPGHQLQFINRSCPMFQRLNSSPVNKFKVRPVLTFCCFFFFQLCSSNGFLYNSGFLSGHLC